MNKVHPQTTADVPYGRLALLFSIGSLFEANTKSANRLTIQWLECPTKVVANERNENPTIFG